MNPEWLRVTPRVTNPTVEGPGEVTMMDLNLRRRFLLAGVGGILVAGLLREILPSAVGSMRALVLAAALILTSLVIYRFLPKRPRR